MLAGSLSFIGQLCGQKWSPEKPESTEMEGAGGEGQWCSSHCVGNGQSGAGESSRGLGLWARN